MIRIWTGVFWSPAEEAPGASGSSAAPVIDARPEWHGMLIPTAAVVACTLAVAAATGPLYALSERTAHDLLDRSDYITEVSRR